MSQVLDLSSVRAKKARAARRIGKTGYRILIALCLIAATSGVLLIAVKLSLGWILIALALAIYMIAAWYHYNLSVLPPEKDKGLTGLASQDLLALMPKEQSTLEVLRAIRGHWQVNFLMTHFLLSSEELEVNLGQETNIQEALDEAWRLSQWAGCSQIEPGFLLLGIISSSPDLKKYLTTQKKTPLDIDMAAAWLGRLLNSFKQSANTYGGIGRDWASGFTPTLDQFSTNISRSVETGAWHFGYLSGTDTVKQMLASMEQGAVGLALVGDAGIGKTSQVYAFAQRLIEGKSNELAYHQVVGLNASLILSAAHEPGALEQILLQVMSEAAHAGNIILFLDEAQLFFGDGTGALDVSQILLPVIQSRRVRLILAFAPADYQRLKASHPSLVSAVTPVVMREPDEAEVMRILEDTALGLEATSRTLITYEALREAFRLSGRYNQDLAYPGKAINLLEQALPHSSNGILLPESVQAAVEQTQGVKVSSAAPAEAESLLNLEADIHKRMVNQTRAVTVVANALRRARAGVANPKRPIGSFLFLGPTGVGKTELAKAVSATYFRAEENMIRLDMSEYQQESDVSRILSDGSAGESLILAVRKQPFSVVLLDEIEKAHPNILNLLLQMLDEGQLTDISGRSTSFKDCVIIATSNAGAQEIRERVERGEALESFEQTLTDNLISAGQFKPELLNRFDEIVLFRPLNQAELAQVVGFMLDEVNRTLSLQNVKVILTEEAIHKLVESGYDPRLGARPMRRMVQKAVEDAVATKILKGEASPGTEIHLDVKDLSIP